MDLRDDLFIIDREERIMVYSPLRRAIFFANKSAVQEVQRYVNGDISIQDISNTQLQEYLQILSSKKIYQLKLQNKNIEKSGHLVIIPSQMCNLSCTYCYAQEARSKDILDKEKLKTIIDFTLRQTIRKKKISFIGGGEPLVTWSLIKWAVEYIEENKKRDDVVRIGITTNATLINEQMLYFFKKHSMSLNISFDILPDIQDSQRPFHTSSESTFNVVNENINKLAQLQIPFGIRSTITKKNVNRMPEMVKFVKENYPVLKKIHFEPVTDPDECDNSYYSSFEKYFILARKIGKELGLNVFCSISNAALRVKECFCGGEMCITPIGSIVACHRVSSENDSAYEQFHYGYVTDKEVFFDQSKINDYLNFSKKKDEKCKKCFAYWHCSGICPMERVSLSTAQLESKCEFMKNIVSWRLENWLLKKLE